MVGEDDAAQAGLEQYSEASNQEQFQKEVHKETDALAMDLHVLTNRLIAEGETSRGLLGRHTVTGKVTGPQSVLKNDPLVADAKAEYEPTKGKFGTRVKSFELSEGFRDYGYGIKVKMDGNFGVNSIQVSRHSVRDSIGLYPERNTFTNFWQSHFGKSIDWPINNFDMQIVFGPKPQIIINVGEMDYGLKFARLRKGVFEYDPDKNKFVDKNPPFSGKESNQKVVPLRTSDIPIESFLSGLAGIRQLCDVTPILRGESAPQPKAA